MNLIYFNRKTQNLDKKDTNKEFFKIKKGQNNDERLIYLNLNEEQQNELHNRLLFDLDQEDIVYMKKIYFELTNEPLSQDYIDLKIQKFLIEKDSFYKCVKNIKNLKWIDDLIPYYQTTSILNCIIYIY